MTPAVYITAASIGAAAALVGVGLKMLYDILADRARHQRETKSTFIAERKIAFDDFLAANRECRRYRDKLHKLTEMALRGEEPPQGTLETFPDSPMNDLVASLEQVRRLARTYPVIRAADAIVRLYADMSVAEKSALDSPHDPNNDLAWFLLCRFSEDREREFVHAYRDELGLGMPEGAPIGYMAPRHPRLDAAEQILRAHVAARRTVLQGPPGDAPSNGDASDLADSRSTDEHAPSPATRPATPAPPAATGPEV